MTWNKKTSSYFIRFNFFSEELKEKARKEHEHLAIFPCKLKILPEHVFNTRNPIVVGVKVEAGQLKKGVPLCVPSKNVRILTLSNKDKMFCISFKNFIIPSGYLCALIRLICFAYNEVKTNFKCFSVSKKFLDFEKFLTFDIYSSRAFKSEPSHRFKGITKKSPWQRPLTT